MKLSYYQRRVLEFLLGPWCKSAIDRMVELITEAVAEDPRRIATRPGPAAERRRRAEKQHRAKRKAARRRPSEDEIGRAHV